jgi:TldD protein
VQDLAGHAIDAAVAAGAGYADARVVQRRAQLVATKNGEVDSVSDAETEGVGVRVLVDGAWGFAGDPRLSEEGAHDAAVRAVSFARASASRARTRVELAPIPPANGNYVAPMERDPVDVPRRSRSACAPRRACAAPR